MEAFRRTNLFAAYFLKRHLFKEGSVEKTSRPSRRERGIVAIAPRRVPLDGVGRGVDDVKMYRDTRMVMKNP